MRVCLVDGTDELIRCFHDAPSHGRGRARVGRRPRDVRDVLCARERSAVTHVAVAFDSVVSRVGRAEAATDEGLIAAQTPLAAHVLRALGITIWPAGRFQADELLASGARRYAAEPGAEQVVVCTPDRRRPVPVPAR